MHIRIQWDKILNVELVCFVLFCFMHVFFAVHYLQFFYLFDLLVVLSIDTALKTIFLLQICAVCFRILYSLFLDVLHFTDSLFQNFDDTA